MKTEFSVFRVKAGMEVEAAEWMDLIAKRQQECVQTLEREKIHFESVLRFEREGRVYLAWFTVQNDEWVEVDETSPFEVDQLHCHYWDRCIDPDFGQEDWEHIVSFLPPAIDAVIQQRDASFLPEKGDES